MKTRIILCALWTAVFLCACDRRTAEETNTEKSKMNRIIPGNEVEVAVLEKKPFTMELLSNGRLSAGERASLSFGTSGILREICCSNGQKVARGTVIARLDRDAVKLDLDAAEIAFEKAKLDLYDVLAGQGYAARDTLSVPPEVLSVAKMRSGYLVAENNLAKARYEYAHTELRAPFAGRVAGIDRKCWDVTSATEPFCTLLGDRNMTVDFTIMESDYALVRTGLPVRVSPFGGNSGTLSGRISSINPVVDGNGQVTCTATLANDGTLLDGMNVRVVVEREMEEMFVVPRSAVVIRDNLDVLFRYRSGKAEWVYVNILHSNGGSHAIRANTERGAVLNAGDSIIVSGNLNLADDVDVVLK